MSDRKYRPVYMFIFMGLMLMVIMMNYSFNLIYYIQNRIYENAVKTLFPVETYFEDNYEEIEIFCNSVGYNYSIYDSKYNLHVFEFVIEQYIKLHDRLECSLK